MSRWVVISIVLAMVAGLLGSTGFASRAAYIAQVLPLPFLVLLVLSPVFGDRIQKNIS